MKLGLLAFVFAAYLAAPTQAFAMQERKGFVVVNKTPFPLIVHFAEKEYPIVDGWKNTYGEMIGVTILPDETWRFESPVDCNAFTYTIKGKRKRINNLTANSIVTFIGYHDGMIEIQRSIQQIPRLDDDSLDDILNCLN